jgi:hypothetical protein
MSFTPPIPPLYNWDVRRAPDLDWIPWGTQDKAHALIRAGAGYQTSAHDHAFPEFFYLLDGVVRNQGLVMNAGDAYAAGVGSIHTDFEIQSPASYLSIFRL